MRGDRSIPFVLIVEDHPLVADSLVYCVRACDAAMQVDTAESLRAALEILVQRPAPILIVTDLTLTDMTGMEIVRQLRAAAPQSPLLVFTALDDPALSGEAKELGAIAYLVKSTSIEALRGEIRAVIGARAEPSSTAPECPEPLDSLLTLKQLIVLEELVAGRSNKEIAARLNISDQTVGSHMKEIFSRLAVRNRTEAVVRYFQIIDRQPHEHRRHRAS